MPKRTTESKIAKFARLKAPDKWLLIRAAAWLAVARIMLARNSFDSLSEKLQRRQTAVNKPGDSRYFERVRYAIAAASANVPWRSDCFPQSIAGYLLLRRDGFAPVIHFGIAREEGENLDGHAWLTCGDFVVTGGAEVHRFSEIHRL